MPTGRAFHDRLLELMPVYTGAGQRLVRLDVSAQRSDDQAVAYALADRACRSWLRGAIPPSADMLDSIASDLEDLDPVRDPTTAAEAIEAAHDARVIAEPLPGTQDVAQIATLAEACARAAARGEHAEAGRLAANCLAARRADAGDQYVLAEAIAVLGAPAS